MLEKFSSAVRRCTGACEPNLQLALYDKRAGAHDLPLTIQDDENVVSARCSLHLVETSLELLLADIADVRQHPQHLQEAIVVVASLQRPHCVAIRQRSDNIGRDQRRRKQGVGGNGAIGRSHGKVGGRVPYRSWCKWIRSRAAAALLGGLHNGKMLENGRMRVTSAKSPCCQERRNVSIIGTA